MGKHDNEVDGITTLLTLNCIGILIEHFAGKWPFWLSPRQVMVIPVGMGFVPYAQEVKEILKKARIFVDIDTTGNTLPKKVRNAQLAQYNFVFGKLPTQPT